MLHYAGGVRNDTESRARWGEREARPKMGEMLRYTEGNVALSQAR